MKRKRHNPEQIIRKLRSAEQLLNQGQTVDRLPAPWQWPVAVVGTYGCRHHEALLHAEVMPSGLVRIAAGKTDAR